MAKVIGQGKFNAPDGQWDFMIIQDRKMFSSHSKLPTMLFQPTHGTMEFRIDAQTIARDPEAKRPRTIQSFAIRPVENKKASPIDPENFSHELRSALMPYLIAACENAGYNVTDGAIRPLVQPDSAPPLPELATVERQALEDGADAFLRGEEVPMSPGAIRGSLEDNDRVEALERSGNFAERLRQEPPRGHER